MTDGNNANRTAVALGNFDGMHVGHMAVLEAAKSFESEGLLPVAVLFDEHSLKAITGKAPAMLMTVTERNRIINENGLGIETLVFNEIRDLSPSDFVEKILVGRLGAAAVCCGYNYRFGKGASGTAQTMSEICGRLGLQCRVSGEVDVDRCAVSSTKIRGFIENGEIENITEEAAEEAAPPAEETTQMAAADTAGPETDGISVVETNEAAAQENEQAQEPSDEAAGSEEDGNAVDANVMESSTLAAEAGNTCVVLYEDIKVKILTEDVREDGIYYTAEVTASAYEDAFSVGTTCNLYADTDAQPLVAEQEYTLTLAAGERAEYYKIVQ